MISCRHKSAGNLATLKRVLNQRFCRHWQGSKITVIIAATVTSSSVICQTTGPKPLPKRFLHIVRSRASSFNWQYPLLSLRSFSSFLLLLPRLLVTSICPFIFLSITCCRRQFLRKMWPIQLAFRFLISCRIFLCSLTLSNISSFSHMIGPTDLLHPSPVAHFKTFQAFLICKAVNIFTKYFHVKKHSAFCSRSGCVYMFLVSLKNMKCLVFRTEMWSMWHRKYLKLLCECGAWSCQGRRRLKLVWPGIRDLQSRPRSFCVCNLTSTC